MSTVSPPARIRRSVPRLQRYGRYVLVDRLGAGGMAEVFRAVVIGPEQFERVVVVKRILPHLTENPGFVKMFIDEATLCGRLSHPNIIQVYEFGREDGSYFIAMEFVDGLNLANVLGDLAERGETLPVGLTADILRQTCLGLGYAHGLTSADGKALNIIHRDVTPSNIMISYAGSVKILDFGIARVANIARISTTDAGQVKGKSSYLAPEQVRGAPFDYRVDIFATGIVLHETLTGRRLFKGANPVHTLELIEKLPVPSPSRFNPDVPPLLDEIVLRALERDPDRRYQSALEMAEALEGFLIERRYSSQEVGRFMRALFAGDMIAGAAMPSEEIRALASSPVPTVESKPMVVTTELTPAPRPPSSGSVPPVRSADPWSLPGWPATMRGPTSRPRGRGLLVAAALVALLLGGAGTLLRQSPRLPTAATVDPAASGVAARAAPDPATVVLTLTSDPTDALVYRIGDTRPLGRTPLTVEVPRGRDPVEIRFVKEGHAPAQLTVIPDQSRPTKVSLAPLSAAPPGEAPTRRPRWSRRNHDKIRNAVPIDPFAP
jgi:serine/threonine protein kinase